MVNWTKFGCNWATFDYISCYSCHSTLTISLLDIFSSFETQGQQKTFKCSICPELFFSKSAIWKHEVEVVFLQHHLDCLFLLLQACHPRHQETLVELGLNSPKVLSYSFSNQGFQLNHLKLKHCLELNTLVLYCQLAIWIIIVFYISNNAPQWQRALRE